MSQKRQEQNTQNSQETYDADKSYFQKNQWDNFYRTIYAEGLLKNKSVKSQIGELNLVKIIGEGSLGSVYLAKNCVGSTKQEVVVKQMSILRFNNLMHQQKEASIQQIFNEVEFLQHLQHPNLVSYLGVVRESSSLNVIQEYFQTQ